MSPIFFSSANLSRRQTHLMVLRPGHYLLLYCHYVLEEFIKEPVRDTGLTQKWPTVGRSSTLIDLEPKFRSASIDVWRLQAILDRTLTPTGNILRLKRPFINGIAIYDSVLWYLFWNVRNLASLLTIWLALQNCSSTNYTRKDVNCVVTSLFAWQCGGLITDESFSLAAS